MTSAFKQKGIQNAIVGKRGMKFIEFTAKLSKFPSFFIFDNIVPILDTFLKFTSMRNIIGSVLKRLAAGSVP